jgi:tetratricopeptide (TPR) repeat protein
MSQFRVFTVIALATSLTACGGSREAIWDRETKVAEGAELSTDVSTAIKAEADAAWALRADPVQTKLAIEKWEQALAASPKDMALLTMLAQAYRFYGDLHQRLAGDKDGMLASLEKGVTLGERAMVASSAEFEGRVKAGEKPENAVSSISIEGQPAMYWYSVCLGKWANEQGIAALLKYKERIFKIMERVLALDPTYYYGAPHRYFGVYFAKAPGFAGGDMGKAKEHFLKSIELAPDYLATKVLYAEFWATKEDEEELFYELLDQVIAGDATKIPEVAPEQVFEIEKAKRLKAEGEDIF